MAIFNYPIDHGVDVINLTPHAINVVVDGKNIEIPPSGQVARVAFDPVPQETCYSAGVLIPVVFNSPGQIENLPDPKRNTVYLVSALVLAQTDRRDVFAPDTGPTAIRNDKGQIEAVTQFVAARQTMGKCDFCGHHDDLVFDHPFGDGPLCHSCCEGLAESE